MRNLNLIILTSLTIFLYIWFKKILDKNLFKIKDNYLHVKDEYDELLSENTRLKLDSSGLKNTLEQIILLYEITKQICKSLEIDVMINLFKDEINRYIKVSDCKFLKSDTDLSPYNEYTVLPLKMDKNPIGYLAVSDLMEQDMDKFDILAQQFLLGIKRAILYQRVQELAITDSLTGVFNRRYSLQRFDEDIERSKKLNYSFSCLMVDIDHFKDYNDRYGHLVGDAVLREVSKKVKENIRQIDSMGRYGGDEFLLILIETDTNEARFAAERIREAIEHSDIKAYDENLKATISIGISAFPFDGKDIKTLIDKADSALYRAKETGRNRVCIYENYK